MKVRPINANDLEQFAYCTEPATMINPYGGDYVVKMEDVENLPTLDWVPVKYGRWKDRKCTNCDFDLRCLIDGESEFKRWVWDVCFSYCPVCGAKMEVE